MNTSGSSVLLSARRKNKIKRGKRSEAYILILYSLKAHDIFAVGRTFLTDIFVGSRTFSRDFCHANFPASSRHTQTIAEADFVQEDSKQEVSAQRSNRLSAFLAIFRFIPPKVRMHQAAMFCPVPALDASGPST